MKSDMSYCRKTAVDQVISDFLFHCQYEKNLNEKTIYAYRSDLYMFKRYIHELYPSVVFDKHNPPSEVYLIDPNPRADTKEWLIYKS